MAAPLVTSSPASDLWHPGPGDTYSETAWFGSALGIAMHAILSFFSLFFTGLRLPLKLFAPAERLALVVAAGAPPFVRWVVLLCSLAAFWGLVAVALHAGFHALGDRARR